MNAKQILAKLKAYPLALSLIGAAILLAGWAYWRSTGALVEAHDQLEVVTQQNDKIDKNTKASELQDEQLAELNADAAKLVAGLVNPVEDIANQQYFYDLERTANVEQESDPLPIGVVRTKDPAEPSVATFTLSVLGHWDTVMAFLYDLQSGPHPVRFSQFQLAKSQQIRSVGSDTERLKLTLTVDMLGK